MSAINKLLNPAPTAKNSDSEFEPSRKTNRYDTDDQSESSARKKVKLCKDAAVFTRGPIHGECRYPPQEFQDELLLAKHREFQLYPMGRIADFPRHIPYSSEKKSFLQKTGRDSLEVFQYEFKAPHSDVVYSMLWDYNIGLVRTTPLFKCMGHSKTTPAKMLNRNPGLREICHSITGGALVAQGYWMPFDAAKAVAATFCWDIRYALTPVFGPDFPDICLPTDHPKHGDMTIDPSITRNCTVEALVYRNLEHDHGSCESTTTPTLSPSMSAAVMSSTDQTMMTRPVQVSEPVYHSDTSNDDERKMFTAQFLHHKQRPIVSTPRSVPPSSVLPPKEIQHQDKPSIFETQESPETSSSRYYSETDDGYDGGSSSTDNSPQHNEKMWYTPEEIEAAQILANMKSHAA